MKEQILGLLFAIGTGLFLFQQSMAVEETLDSSYAPVYEPSPVFPLNSSPPLPQPSLSASDAYIYQKAQAITVKVLSGQTGGSGLLIQRQGSTYWVVTNYHVLIFGQRQQAYTIITPDGQKYPAQVLKTGSKSGQDLAILAFNSPYSYQVATLSFSTSINLGQEVFAVGFPTEVQGEINPKLVMNKGIIAQLSPQPFGGGYQIGYTSRVEKGMSGGALLNRNGEIIGINGVHKYPLWGNPYIFADGSRANALEKQQMSQYSWAIPLQTLLKIIS